MIMAKRRIMNIFRSVSIGEQLFSIHPYRLLFSLNFKATNHYIPYYKNPNNRYNCPKS